MPCIAPGKKLAYSTNSYQKLLRQGVPDDLLSIKWNRDVSRYENICYKMYVVKISYSYKITYSVLLKWRLTSRFSSRLDQPVISFSVRVGWDGDDLFLTDVEL